jgi:prepilin-type N-terminal cleavage/methylation domain-containing protein
MRGFTVIELMIVVAIIAVLLTTVVSLPVGCEARWERSGMRAEWGLWTGCQVEVSAGRWLPESRLREIDLRGGSK